MTPEHMSGSRGQPAISAKVAPENRPEERVAAPHFAALAEALPEPVVFLGVDPNYALGPEAWLPRYAVACRHETGVLRLLEAAGVEVFCLERAVGTAALPGRATAGLAGHAAVREWLRGVAGAPQRLSILLFKPSTQVETLAGENGWRLLGASSRIARPLENKVNFFRLLDELALPHPAWEEVDLSTATYADVASRLGERLVVQGAHGFSGNRTFAVDSPDDFAAAAVRLRQRRARAARRATGSPATLNACVHADGTVRVGQLFHQVTGAAECTVYPLGACGNDWAAAPFPAAAQAAAEVVTRAVSRVLAERGFRGIFGMDFLVDAGGAVTAIEINPRLVSSIPMTTRLEASAGTVPLLVHHLLACAGAPTLAGEAAYPRLRGAQLVLHNLTGSDARVRGALAAGIYALRGGAPAFLRPSFQADAATGADEFLVLPPVPGHLLSEAGECARVQMLRPVLRFPEGVGHGVGALTEEASAIARAVYAALAPEPVGVRGGSDA